MALPAAVQRPVPPSPSANTKRVEMGEAAGLAAEGAEALGVATGDGEGADGDGDGLGAGAGAEEDEPAALARAAKRSSARPAVRLWKAVVAIVLQKKAW